jgi:hypothetical protein
MRRQYRTHDLVYNQLFPSPTASDPPDFHQHLIRNLITEVRIETHRFYGGLETIEAKYPGLNYAYAPHRKRLARFPHHARLFDAFDALGLTSYEIGELCKWEGTLWARQRYERDEGVKVTDTTGNEIKPWVRGKNRNNASGHKRNSSGHIKARYENIHIPRHMLELGEERRIPSEPVYAHSQPQMAAASAQHLQPLSVPLAPAWSIMIPVAREVQHIQSAQNDQVNRRASPSSTTTVFVTQSLPSPSSQSQSTPTPSTPTLIQHSQQQTTHLPSPPHMQGDIECGEDAYQKDDEIRPLREQTLLQVFEVPATMLSPVPSSPPSMAGDPGSVSSP